MIKKLLNTNDSLTGTFLRFGLALTVLPHGYQKMLDFSNMLDVLETHYGLPIFIGLFVILIEFFGSILLLLGVYTRISGALLGVVLLGAGFFHLDNGFYINWLGNQAGEGYQFHLLYVLTACAVVINGGGRFSLDRVIQNKK
jgi:putative oxidoreductase